MIALRNVQFAYPRGAFRLEIEALDIGRESHAAIVGPSGSGKTTLLHLIAGIQRPASGRIAVDDVEVSALSDGQRRAFRSGRVGLVFQDFGLLDYLNVWQNMLLPYRITAALVIDRNVEARGRELASAVGLSDKLKRNVNDLSQGEKQRVAICRALLPKPSVVLADEPTGNLDPRAKGQVLDLLFEQCNAAGATLVMVTHDHGLLDRFEQTIDFAAYTAAGEAVIP
jgi:putative ABC transport system ATP-binding protein